MISQSFKRICDYTIESIEASEVLRKGGFIAQSMVIIYSTIDTLGYLESENSDKATGTTFKKWCENYILNNPKCNKYFPGSDEDLWSARCGVLHTHSPISDLVKKQKAKPVAYIQSEVSFKELHTQDTYKKLVDSGRVPLVHEGFVIVLVEGINQFIVDFDAKLKSQKSDFYVNKVNKLLSTGIFQFEPVTSS